MAILNLNPEGDLILTTRPTKRKGKEKIIRPTLLKRENELPLISLEQPKDTKAKKCQLSEGSFSTQRPIITLKKLTSKEEVLGEEASTLEASEVVATIKK